MQRANVQQKTGEAILTFSEADCMFLSPRSVNRTRVVIMYMYIYMYIYMNTPHTCEVAHTN